MKKSFSLGEFLKELLAQVEGTELSWDFKLYAIAGEFLIRIPIKFYAAETRHSVLRFHVENSAAAHGLTVSNICFNTLGDNMILEGRFADITGAVKK